MLTCPVNVSEGRDASLMARLTAAGGDSLLDVHSDAIHNRSVLTLGGRGVIDAVRRVAREAVATIDVRLHSGVHPRMGSVDVVPFVPIGESTIDDAVEARNEFARWAGESLSLPVFLYGPERTLPSVRREAFRSLQPDEGPPSSHRSAGACCAGARPPLVAWNAWVAGHGLAVARQVVRELRVRLAGVRALAFEIGEFAQVSCNLVEPHVTGPDRVYDFVSERVPVLRSELVGLVPDALLQAIPRQRWEILDLSADRTIEARLARGSTPSPG